MRKGIIQGMAQGAEGNVGTTRTRSARWPILLIVVALVALPALLGWDMVRSARQGKASLERAVVALEARDPATSAREFRAAQDAFAHARGLLLPQALDPIIQQIPWAGRQYVASRRLISIGWLASRAGKELLLALAGAAPADARAPVSVAAALARFREGRPHLLSALKDVTEANSLAASLRERDLAPALRDATRSVRRKLAALEGVLPRAPDLLALSDFLLSRPRRLVLLSQDGAEIRPTGGFIGSYGIVETGPSGVSLVRYEDVYELPDPPGKVRPPTHADWVTNDWSLRDANWWLDFPASARAVLRFWRAYREPPADGVIAIDTVVVRDLLAATGPVTLPGYGKFTADNMLGRLLTIVEVGRGRPKAAPKKAVLAALASTLLARVMAIPPSQLGPVARSLADAADQKHIQFFMTDPATEATIDRLGWSGAVKPRDGAKDLVAPFDAMIRATKTNIAMRKRVAYEVELGQGGSALTTLALSYANTAPFDLPLRGLFRDYVRVARAPGTVPPGAPPYSELGLPTRQERVSLDRGMKVTKILRDQLRVAWTSIPGGGVYRLTVCRQADLEDVPWVVTVRPPTGWRVSGATAWSVPSSATLPVIVGPDRASFSGRLRSDMVFEVRIGAPGR
jgi:hypothetical protein